MLKTICLLFILIVQILNVHSEDLLYPETYDITGFPSQNQAIYGGWIEANSTTGSLLYYNLYSKDNTDINSTSNDSAIPLIIFLAGGPGDPSTFVAFTEIGPYLAHGQDFDFANITLQSNPNSFTKSSHLLVIDQPIGTGFSVRREDDVVESSDQAAENLLTFFLRFYELYPALKSTPTYFYGHSYGGKWVPVLLDKWLKGDQFSDINLAGVIIGNGFIDPIHQVKFADFTYNFGLITKKQRDYLLEKEAEAFQLYQDKNWAASIFVYTETQAYLEDVNVSGGVWPYSLDLYLPPAEYNLTVPLEYMRFIYADFILSNSSSEIRNEILKIPEEVNWTNLSPDVQNPLVLSGDFANSTVFGLEAILKEDIPTLLYVGQNDAVINYPGAMEYLAEVDWEGMPEFLEANKTVWFAGDTVAGSYQNFSNLYFAVVNRAGHFSVFDQGASVVALVDLFINSTISS